MNYTVQIAPTADRVLESIHSQDRDRIIKKIISLSSNPRPDGVKKLKGEINQWRIRVGKYRIIYEIYDDRLLVVVGNIDKRGEVYKD